VNSEATSSCCTIRCDSRSDRRPLLDNLHHSQTDLRLACIANSLFLLLLDRFTLRRARQFQAAPKPRFTRNRMSKKIEQSLVRKM
jgi:hypothetical protein